MNKLYATEWTGHQRLIIQTLTYFEYFSHPLSILEIAKICGVRPDVAELEMEPLLKEGWCFKSGSYYGTNHNIKTWVALRAEKELLAVKYFSKLKFYSRIIASFPFVKAVAVSGSLSKGVMTNDGDIDYFIITSAGRLWMCRTLLVLFKKTVLFNSKKYFCVNYFVDENNLEIRDKNIFTATEMRFLIPVYSQNKMISDFSKANNWVKDYYPTFPDWNTNNFKPYASGLKRILEKILNMRFLNKVEYGLHYSTQKLWRKKFKSFKEEKLELTMRSTIGVSKHHPSDFQTKVLNSYEKAITKINHSVPQEI